MARQPTITRHIGIEDGSKLSQQTIFHAEVSFFEIGRPENTISGAEGWRANGRNEGMSGRSNLDSHLS